MCQSPSYAKRNLDRRSWRGGLPRLLFIPVPDFFGRWLPGAVVRCGKGALRAARKAVAETPRMW